jgi:protoporphyrinogen IX oxidase
MSFLYLKAVHIIFIVTWFAGLFYMPRLFVYITEAHQRDVQARSILVPQLITMARRLWYGITWPSAVITLGIGIAMLVIQPSWLQAGFMHIKLTMVFLLYLYHFSLQVILNRLEKGVLKYTSNQLRFWNEVATLFLIAIVFLIVLKDSLSMVWGLVGLGIVTILIMLGIRLYRKMRKEN